MVHVPAKFAENTSMRFLSNSAKTKRDGQTDRQTDRQGGVAISPVRRRGR